MMMLFPAVVFEEPCEEEEKKESHRVWILDTPYSSSLSPSPPHFGPFCILILNYTTSSMCAVHMDRTDIDTCLAKWAKLFVHHSSLSSCSHSIQYSLKKDIRWTNISLVSFEFEKSLCKTFFSTWSDWRKKRNWTPHLVTHIPRPPLTMTMASFLLFLILLRCCSTHHDYDAPYSLTSHFPLLLVIY